MVKIFAPQSDSDINSSP
jgi:hypothetical protein